MRALASYLTGLGILASLMFVGGAWTSPSGGLQSVEVHPAHASFGLVREYEAVSTPTTTTTVVLPPGCSIPLEGATCAPTVVAGGLDFPETPAQSTDRFPGREAQAQPPATAAPAQPAAPSPQRQPLAPRDVEVWRPLVEAHFAPADVNKALRVIFCESSGDPNAKNPRSSASGLFQHLGRFWPERSAKAGIPGVDIFDPSANVTVAAWLVYEGGGWSHWNPSRHCWG